MTNIKIIDYSLDNESITDRENEELNDLENWQGDYYYYEKKDWKGLLKLREKMARKSRNDVYAQLRLGEAYVLNKMYDRGLDFLTKLHHRYPDIRDTQHYILDILFETNRTEYDYDWIEKPLVTRLNEEIVEFIYDNLKFKRKPRTISEVFCEILCKKGYLLFDESNLYQYLMNDCRFEVIDRHDIDYLSEVKVSRKK